MDLKSRPVLSVVTLVVVTYGTQGGGAVRPGPTGLGGGRTGRHDEDPLLLSRVYHVPSESIEAAGTAPLLPRHQLCRYPW